jgi:hypothetical protein
MQRCIGMLVGVEARACACRGHGHGGGRDGDNDTAARTAITQKKQGTGEYAGLCARRRRRRHMQEFFSSLARWPASPTASTAARWRTRCFPLGSKAGASADERGRAVLTLVAPSRSEGVGEEKRHGSPAWKRTTASQRMQKTGVCAETAGPAPPHERLRASR